MSVERKGDFLSTRSLLPPRPLGDFLKEKIKPTLINSSLAAALILASSVCTFVYGGIFAREIPKYYALQSKDYDAEIEKLSKYSNYPPSLDSDEYQLGETFTLANLRDKSFEYFNIRHETGEWMRELTINRVANLPDGLAGTYLSGSKEIKIKSPTLHFIFHEYAHANFDRKSEIDKILFSLNLSRLLFDESAQNLRCRRYVEGVLSLVARARQDFADEAYAYLAVWSGGDVERLPEYLKPHYADFLQAGENQWIRMQEDATRKRIPGSPNNVQKVSLTSG